MNLGQLEAPDPTTCAVLVCARDELHERQRRNLAGREPRARHREGARIIAEPSVAPGARRRTQSGPASSRICVTEERSGQFGVLLGIGHVGHFAAELAAPRACGPSSGVHDRSLRGLRMERRLPTHAVGASNAKTPGTEEDRRGRTAPRT